MINENLINDIESEYLSFNDKTKEWKHAEDSIIFKTRDRFEEIVQSIIYIDLEKKQILRNKNNILTKASLEHIKNIYKLILREKKISPSDEKEFEEMLSSLEELQFYELKQHDYQRLKNLYKLILRDKAIFFFGAKEFDEALFFLQKLELYLQIAEPNAIKFMPEEDPSFIESLDQESSKELLCLNAFIKLTTHKSEEYSIKKAKFLLAHKKYDQCKNFCMYISQQPDTSVTSNACQIMAQAEFEQGNFDQALIFAIRAITTHDFKSAYVVFSGDEEELEASKNNSIRAYHHKILFAAKIYFTAGKYKELINFAISYLEPIAGNNKQPLTTKIIKLMKNAVKIEPLLHDEVQFAIKKIWHNKALANQKLPNNCYQSQHLQLLLNENSCWEKLHRLDPENISALLGLTFTGINLLYFYEMTREDFEKYLAQLIKTADLQLKLSYEECVKKLAVAISLLTQNWEEITKDMSLSDRKGCFQSVLQFFNQFPELSSEKIKFILNACRIFWINNDLLEAEKNLLDLLKIEPKNKSAFCYLIRMHGEKNNLDKGILYLSQLIQFAPDEDVLFHEKHDTAINTLFKIYRELPLQHENYISLLLDALNLAIDTKELNQGVFFAKQILQKDPKFIAALNGLGVIYQTQQNYQQAANCFEKAFQFSNSNYKFLYQQARCYQAAQEFHKAINCYKQIPVNNNWYTAAQAGIDICQHQLDTKIISSNTKQAFFKAIKEVQQKFSTMKMDFGKK